MKKRKKTKKQTKKETAKKAVRERETNQETNRKERSQKNAMTEIKEHFSKTVKEADGKEGRKEKRWIKEKKIDG